MPVPSRARRALTLIVAVTVSTTLVAPSALAKEPKGLDRFMWAIGWWESGGRYNVRNDGSGAFGKYQFMPESWREWSGAYLGTADAARTPTNQEAVARAKLASLYQWLGSWDAVAFWWLTGTVRDPKAKMHASTFRYVNGVMALYRRGPRPVDRNVASSSTGRPFGVQDGDRRLLLAGNWTIARHAGYRGGSVAYATRAGASATVTFSGRRISWVGPTGPTRGRARVLIDGIVSGTVDLRSPSFRATRTLFTRAWRVPGVHTLTIEVLPTPHSRPVAIDELVVRP